MKKAGLIFLLAAVFINSSCTKTTGSAGHDVFVDLQYGFDNDAVKIFIDGEQIFNDRITSNPSLGFATGLSLRQKAGLHTIRVQLNDQHSAASVFALGKNLWIGLGYTRLGKVSFNLSDKPFMYD